jgi:hypothetical protein
MSSSVDHRPDWNPHAGQRPDLGAAPCIHPTATVRGSRIGAWTEIGAYTTLLESEVGDYSYLAGCHSQVWCAGIGKFTSIASAVCINPPTIPCSGSPSTTAPTAAASMGLTPPQRGRRPGDSAGALPGS